MKLFVKEPNIATIIIGILGMGMGFLAMYAGEWDYAWKCIAAGNLLFWCQTETYAGAASWIILSILGFGFMGYFWYNILFS